MLWLLSFQPLPVGLIVWSARLPGPSGDVGDQHLWWAAGSRLLLGRSVGLLSEGA